jgi:hypothetical protein
MKFDGSESDGADWAKVAACALRHSTANTSHRIQFCFVSAIASAARADREKGKEKGQSNEPIRSGGGFGTGERNLYLFVALCGTRRSLAAILCLKIAAGK